MLHSNALCSTHYTVIRQWTVLHIYCHQTMHCAPHVLSCSTATHCAPHILSSDNALCSTCTVMLHNNALCSTHTVMLHSNIKQHTVLHIYRQLKSTCIMRHIPSNNTLWRQTILHAPLIQLSWPRAKEILLSVNVTEVCWIECEWELTGMWSKW